MNAIFPADFLAFLIGAPGVLDRNFKDARPSLGEFHSELNFYSESLTLELLSAISLTSSHLLHSPSAARRYTLYPRMPRAGAPEFALHAGRVSTCQKQIRVPRAKYRCDHAGEYR